ncbi:hypothetical protein [Nonomuraea africana]|uniref:hypothetical protein n=1 Tax=Nonomuraea africana TaxID=46171 RepID=UPI00340B2C96
MLEIGDVAAIPLPQGGYGACQVSGVSAEASFEPARRSGLPDPDAAAWFDEWRYF